MKVYVASKFENYRDVIRVQSKAQQYGHTITYDWAEESAIPVLERQITVDEEWQRKCTVNDVRGVQECHLFIVLSYPGMQGFGTWIEFGVALGMGRSIIVVGEVERDSVFLHHPNVQRVTAPVDLYEILKRLGPETPTKV